MRDSNAVAGGSSRETIDFATARSDEDPKCKALADWPAHVADSTGVRQGKIIREPFEPQRETGTRLPSPGPVSLPAMAAGKQPGEQDQFGAINEVNGARFGNGAKSSQGTFTARAAHSTRS